MAGAAEDATTAGAADGEETATGAADLIGAALLVGAGFSVDAVNGQKIT